LSGAAAVGKIGFFAGPEGLTYARRLGRLRWRRRFSGHEAALLLEGDPAERAFSGSESWLVVRDDAALPVPGGEPARLPGRVLLASALPPAGPPAVHTLSEFERAVFPPGEDPSPEPDRAPACAFAVSDFPPAPGETVGGFLRRLLLPATPRAFSPDFAAVVFDEGPGGERPEVTRLFPEGIRRLLDVGCGGGRASAALKRERPLLSVTGIERDGAAAARARRHLDRVLAGEAPAELVRLATAGEKFDGFLFADVLEHLENPVGALAAARDLASPSATLVASVPNVGHLSIVRDLILGRFDPLPAGLADAGHLRWFTRSFLEEALDEAGWRADVIEPVPGAPAPEGEEFLGWAQGWPDADRASLGTYQWISVARPK